MPGRVEIINIALARLGESPIQSLDEGSTPANAAKQLYDTERQATLRDYPWNFALKQVSLARVEETSFGFHTAFALPADCLRAVRLLGVNGENVARFAVRAEKVYADPESVTLEYVADVEDTGRFDAKFVEAFSYKLAAALAMIVKGSPELMANYTNTYRSLVSDAAAYSAGEAKVYLSDNPYLEARY